MPNGWQVSTTFDSKLFIWVGKKIVGYQAEYAPGSPGVIIFKCEGDILSKKIVSLEPSVFTALLTVLQTGTAVYDPLEKTFACGAGVSVKALLETTDPNNQEEEKEEEEFELLDLSVQKF